MKSSSTNSSDPGAPVIPDYELLKRIGKGGYGEVYVGRSVTGKLRAIKTVRRATFDSERTFEREFEGIQHYEEVSRDHPGLVDILHVGRNDEQGFYYYVMQLADDADLGRDIEIETYAPLTLSRKLRAGLPLPMEECLCVGRNLAGGLQHLHENGLSHRDVKPSNIIYVRGVPQLADPGLVAASGQQTFVGTEGYIPPEGPGSALADLYSLGIVLYEMNTGKDRLDYPELPTRLDAKDPHLKQRAALNQVLCQAAHFKADLRYADGGALIEALNQVESGRVLPPPRRRTPQRTLVAVLLVVAGLGAVAGLSRLSRPHTDPGLGHQPSQFIEQPVAIASTPEGANVFIDGEEAGPTPLVARVPPGTVDLRFQLEGHRTVELTYPVRRGQENRVSADLGRYLIPRPGKPWTNHLGHAFEPVPDDTAHRSLGPIRDGDFTPFVQAMGAVGSLVFERGAQGVIFASSETQRRFCQWMTDRDRAAEFLPPGQVYVQDEIEPLDGFADLSSFRTIVGEPRFGSVRFVTHPAGAQVLSAEQIDLGETPITLGEVAAGPVHYQLILPGHKPRRIDTVLSYREDLLLEIQLEGNDVADLSLPWTNSLGMSLVPAGENLLCAIHETTVGAYERFWDEEAVSERYFDPGFFEQEPTHPAVQVSREDARRYCAWLTRREQDLGRLPDHVRYRLPTDREWSFFAGVPDERGLTPRDRDREYPNLYPWGATWPPPPNAGNFAGMDAANLDDVAGAYINGYDDGFTQTAPVGGFLPNRLGIHDLAGNVSEWVEDRFDEAEDSPFPAVLRGGNWLDSSPDHLRTSYRGMSTEELRSPQCGFRVVLALDPPEVLPEVLPEEETLDGDAPPAPTPATTAAD